MSSRSSRVRQLALKSAVVACLGASMACGGATEPAAQGAAAQAGAKTKGETPGSAAATPVPAEPATELDALAQQARGKVKKFGGALKGELMAAMKEGGPTQALQVCSVSAPSLAAQASSEGWTIARRSDRLRNPRNELDPWERAAFDAFAKTLAEGGDPTKLEHAEILTVEGAKSFRYAKGIVLGGECLACHGTNVKPEVQSVLATLYPDDQATGYKAGELRGLFSVRKAM